MNKRKSSEKTVLPRKSSVSGSYVLLSVLLCYGNASGQSLQESSVSLTMPKLFDASEKRAGTEAVFLPGGWEWIWASSRQRVRAGKQWKALQMISMINREGMGGKQPQRRLTIVVYGQPRSFIFRLSESMAQINLDG